MSKTQKKIYLNHCKFQWYEIGYRNGDVTNDVSRTYEIQIMRKLDKKM